MLGDLYNRYYIFGNICIKQLSKVNRAGQCETSPVYTDGILSDRVLQVVIGVLAVYALVFAEQPFHIAGGLLLARFDDCPSIP